MRAYSPALKSYLDGVRAAGGDRRMLMADCYTFSLLNGPVLRYCDKDVPVTVGGNTFVANSLRISGLRFKCSLGFDVDTQEVDVIANPASATEMIGQVPFFTALRIGLFDGCGIKRDRAFFAYSPNGLAASFAAPAIGSVNLFTGHLATVDALGRTSARLTAASLLSLLDVDMPRNQYQPACNHALYDAGCGLTKSSYGTNGSAGIGSTNTFIAWSGATAAFAQGTVTMTSGVLAGLSAGIKAASAGSGLILILPLAVAPAQGDTFTAYWGCDHTTGPQGCAKFANLQNYRGFPLIPPPSTTYNSTTNTS